MKKLLIINSSCNSGSTGRIAEDICRTAGLKGYECYFAYGRSFNGSECRTIRIGGRINVLCHAIVSFLFDRHGFSSSRATKALIHRIEKIRPDVINIHNIHGYYLNVRLLFEYLGESGIPVVWTMHDCWPFTGHCSFFDRYHCEKWKTGCFVCPNRKGYPTSLLMDRSEKNYREKKELFTGVSNLTLIPVCHWMEEMLSQSFLSGYPSQTIYNGVDLDVFKPGNPDSIKSELGIDAKKKVILGVASIWDRRKGMDDFFRLRRELGDDCLIILIGLSPKQSRSLPEGIIGIHRTENVRQLADCYSMADVFVNPTYVDNFPTTNIEALACGTQVVTYRTGGSPEAVDDRCGFVAERGDFDGLLAYVRIAAERKDQYSSFCRQRAVEMFNKKDRYDDYVRLFDSLIKNK